MVMLTRQEGFLIAWVFEELGDLEFVDLWLGFLDVDTEIHEMIVSKAIELNEIVLNGLADMYVKCGDMSQARLIFEQMTFKNYASWNVLVSGFAIHGHFREAVDFFSRMEKSRVKPYGVTFLSILFACTTWGMFDLFRISYK
ncbi:Pentatricopeptide repeat-containing protein [Abeliophyllum distichum]|uniref:Pentatricopeptide repeat-containing protein n=1 Tax=Abeliophyllum distichum TaxID=126358 RepID=A0ABD1SBN6_9LAMI